MLCTTENWARTVSGLSPMKRARSHTNTRIFGKWKPGYRFCWNSTSRLITMKNGILTFLSQLVPLLRRGGGGGTKTLLKTGFHCIFNKFFYWILIKRGRWCKLWRIELNHFSYQLSHWEGNRSEKFYQNAISSEFKVNSSSDLIFMTIVILRLSSRQNIDLRASSSQCALHGGTTADKN